MEDIYYAPPRGKPFSKPFKPRFNALKWAALIGIQAFYALGFDPIRLKRVAPRFATFASRIYGSIDKAAISKKEALAMRQRISRFVR